MNIKTTYLCPGNWQAVDSDTYDGEGCPIGFGATEQQAIDDLMEQIEARDEL